MAIGRSIRRTLPTIVVALACAGVGATSAAGATLRLTAQPKLFPRFASSITNYITRCEPRGSVRVTVADGTGTPVSVDAQPARRRTFTTTLALTGGQRFIVRTGRGARRASYSVRCLPQNFPNFRVTLRGKPQAAYYLLTLGSAMAPKPKPYAVLFDSHGVPVWWYQEINGVPDQASLLPDGNLSWQVNLGVVTLGEPATIQWEEHRLDGTVVRTVDTNATLPDTPEAQELPDGNFLVTGYALRQASLTPIGGVGTEPVLDARIEEILPNGSVVYTWDAAGRIGLPESVRWWFALTQWRGAPTGAWDTEHITSVQPDGDGFLAAMEHTDAVYLIRRSDGAIEWKLGGTPTPESLTIVGDPHAATDFGAPHDARVLPDGTVSVFDNATARGVVVPGVLRFRIDTQARTATLIQSLSDPLVSSSPCCGSARMLPGGDWVVDWGGRQIMDELAPDGALVLRLTLAAPYYSYRAFPILPGQLSAAKILAGMDTMYPLRPSTPAIYARGR
jgi:hypothetical protein